MQELAEPGFVPVQITSVKYTSERFVENHATSTLLFFQMRLDFNTFAITGPSTETLSTTKVLNGQVNVGAGKESNLASNCATDVFTITNAENLPEMCGTLTGEHGNNPRELEIEKRTVLAIWVSKIVCNYF